jgi:hypothetical protein
MTDNITLRRAVGDEVRDLLCHADFTHFHFAAKRREMLLRAATALAALDAALAEPDAICSVKDNEAALERVANRVKPGQVKGLLPEPPAKREPDVADLFARFAAKQKPLDADMAAILHANLDSLYITEDALREGIDAQDRDLWQRRADEEFLKEYEKRYGKREPATEKQVTKAYMAKGSEDWWSDYQAGWREAERFHGIRKEDK